MGFLRALAQLWYILEYWLDAFWYRIWGASGDRDEDDVRGKVVVITGANAGIGKELAIHLASRGAIIVLGCRNLGLGKLAQEDISFESQSRLVHLFEIDLEDFESIQKFAAQVGEKFPQIHVLCLNAGISVDSEKLQRTKHGYETHMCINHLGHFLLTKFLLPNVQASVPSRIVVISSTMMLFSELDVDDIMMDNHPNPCKRTVNPLTTLPYNNSKRANSLFAKELGRRLRGTGVTVYSVCPGLCDTSIFRHYSKLGMVIVKRTLPCFALSPATPNENFEKRWTRARPRENGQLIKCCQPPKAQIEYFFEMNN